MYLHSAYGLVSFQHGLSYSALRKFNCSAFLNDLGSMDSGLGKTQRSVLRKKKKNNKKKGRKKKNTSGGSNESQPVPRSTYHAVIKKINAIMLYYATLPAGDALLTPGKASVRVKWGTPLPERFGLLHEYLEETRRRAHRGKLPVRNHRLLQGTEENVFNCIKDGFIRGNLFLMVMVHRKKKKTKHKGFKLFQ